ncbi:hypothetical protein DMUE_0349 [Dictyocoela muelleri]|nr:hypothetical protein DMUE_0349 [Dictyocoela muelleri]
MSNNNRRFFCSAICIAEVEDTSTYSRIFENLLSASIGSDDKIKSMKNFNAENAKQITAAVIKYGNDSLKTSCWAHTFRLIKVALDKFPDDLKQNRWLRFISYKA